jgi:hypothetical protein
MEINQIKTLLEKYFEGQSTLAEEQELVEYFSHIEDIPETLINYVPMFSALTADRFRDMAVPGLDEKIAGMIRDEELKLRPVPRRNGFTCMPQQQQ